MEQDPHDLDSRGSACARSKTPVAMARGPRLDRPATRRSRWLLALALASFGCRAVDVVPSPRRVPPLVEPIGFRVESVWFDATRADLAASPGPGSVAGRIDEDDARSRRRLAARDIGGTESAGRPSSVVSIREAPARARSFALPGERVALAVAPPRSGPARVASRSDDAFLEASATLGAHWQLYDLHVDLVLRAPGERAQSLKASTEMPPELWFEIVAVPESSRAPGDPVVIVYVRAVPVWPPTGDA